MIQFNLNIDLFYELELKKDSYVKAIACIEYPIIHIIAKTKETTEEDYDHLDRFIVDTASKSDGINIENIADLTGISPSVFLYRAKEMEKQGLVTVENLERINIEKQGLDFLNDLNFERQIIKTRSFLLDGVSHAPLPSYFYKEGKENLISDSEKDKRGIRIFNPAIIPNPPDRNLKSKILEISIDERANFSIPVGLKDIIDFDFYLMTYPLAVVLSKTREGRTKKRLVDCNGFYADDECVSLLQKELATELNKTEIEIAQLEINKEGKKHFLIQVQNNWAKPRTEARNRIFNFEWSKFQSFVEYQRNQLLTYKQNIHLDFEIPWLFELSKIRKENFVIEETKIQVLVNKKLFETDGLNKKKILEACIRKRDYIRQKPRTGIWLIFIDVIIADEFVQKLVDLFQILQTKISIPELLATRTNNFKELREQLILIERFDYLEELDIHLFLHSRESAYKQNYLVLKNE